MAIPLSRRHTLGPGHYRLCGAHGAPMRVSHDLQKCVAFIGDREELGFSSFGTAFFMLHKGAVYLVTAKHVAAARENDPYCVHFNMIDGASKSLHIDPLEIGQRLKWFFHDDPNVDLAAMLLHLDFPGMGIDSVALLSEAAVKRVFPRTEVGCGDMCYAIGLFRGHSGAARIKPAVHTGHVVMMADSAEPISVDDNGTELSVVGYVAGLANLPGLSGAPVFVRQGLEVDLPVGDNLTSTITASTPDLKLLGIWQGSWRIPDATTGGRVQVGLGIVVPAENLLDLLNSQPVEDHRAAWFKKENQAWTD